MKHVGLPYPMGQTSLASAPERPVPHISCFNALLVNTVMRTEALNDKILEVGVILAPDARCVCMQCTYNFESGFKQKPTEGSFR